VKYASVSDQYFCGGNNGGLKNIQRNVSDVDQRDQHVLTTITSYISLNPNLTLTVL
jgi:hypothetical protein